MFAVFPLLLIIGLSTVHASQPLIWPLPKQYSLSNELNLNVDASKFAFIQNTQSVIINNAFIRYMNLCFPHRSETNGDNNMHTIFGLNVSIQNASEQTLGIDMDESYNISIQQTSTFATLHSKTIWGALRGLETFSQLMIFNTSLRYYQTYNGTIYDSPRFSHRGIMIDTSRHFVPVATITSILDSMSFSKFNVFHWHMTDANSFPYLSTLYPKLATQAAYSMNEIYFANDIKYIINYALDRGIRVIPEFDMPGHAESWCKGYPNICPSPHCNHPLNPASNDTWQLLTGLIHEIANLFVDDHIHLGGDEVNTKCLNQTQSIVDWMNMMNFTDSDAIQYFDERVIDIAYQNKKTVIDWDDVFRNFNATLDPTKVIIQLYTASIHTLFPDIVEAGFRGIYSPDPGWYFPQMGVTWEKRYMVEPLKYINDTYSRLVVGGEGCQWTTHSDASDVQQMIWPAAAAIGERLWSQREINSTANALPRIEYFRCLLNERGIVAAPTNNAIEASPPPGPGSCYSQRRRR